MKRSEFLKTKEMKKIRANINACAYLGYAIAVGSVIVNVIQSGNYVVIFDALFIIAMSLLVHLLQSRVAAIIMTVYAVFNMVIMSLEYGRLAGYLPVLVGVYAIIFTFKFHKAWKEEKEIQKLRDGTYRLDTDTFNE